MFLRVSLRYEDVGTLVIAPGDACIGEETEVVFMNAQGEVSEGSEHVLALRLASVTLAMLSQLTSP